MNSPGGARVVIEQAPSQLQAEGTAYVQVEGIPAAQLSHDAGHLDQGGIAPAGTQVGGYQQQFAAGGDPASAGALSSNGLPDK